MRHLSALLIGALALGCDRSTEPAAHLTFARDVDNASRPALVTTSGAVEYRSHFYLPCVPYQLTAELAESSPQVLEIHIVGDRGTSCFTLTGSTEYVAQVMGLSPGTYTLRVIHSWPDTRLPSDTVVTTSVVVPY